MPTKQVWSCLHCSAKFDTYRHLKQHESVCDKNKCNRCDHAYYVYGWEFKCDRINNGKCCRFKQEVDK